MAKKVAMCVELDYCVGCQACKLACQNYYDLPVRDSYMTMVLQKPDVVDGRHEMFMTPYPYRLNEKCAYCLEKEGENVPCAAPCIGAAIHVGEADEIMEFAAKNEGRVALYLN